MTEDLIAFLLARLAEDERIARAAHQGNWHLEDRKLVGYGLGSNEGLGYVVSTLLGGDAEHIARHDPARVLREVEAKRRLLDWHDIRREPSEFEGKAAVIVWCSSCNESGWCLIAQLLALPYSDHPDYRQDWAPSEAA